MPLVCAVPNCRGNYPTGPKVTIFAFPRELELRQKWIQAIKRHNFTPTKNSRVCELHFKSEDIETKTTFRNEETGLYLEAPLKRRRLAIGNYGNGGPKVSTFSFPRNRETQQKWIRAIKRSNFTPTRASRVCELHFKPHEIERVTSYYVEATGETLTASLKCPRLIEGAVPSKITGYIPDGPSQNLPEATCPDMDTVESTSDSSTSHGGTDPYSSIDEAFIKMVSLEEGWVKVQGRRNLCFFYLNESPEEEQCIHQLSVYLSEDLVVKVFRGELQIKTIPCSDKSVFNLPLKVSDTNTLSKLLNESKKFLLDNFRQNCPEVRKEKLSLVSDMLELMSEQWPEKRGCLKFFQEQVTVLTKPHDNRFRYPYDTLLFACLVHCFFPLAYKFVRRLNAMSLPSPRTIKAICVSFDEQSDPDFLKYASNKFSSLDDTDKKVVLMLDALHIVKPNSDITPNADDTVAESTTSAHVFMVSSLTSTYKDVVHITLVNILSIKGLYEITKKVIVGLENIGYEVVAVVTDNNVLYKKTLAFLNGDDPQVLNEYPHPCDPNRPLFYIVDPVDILNNIRNSWTNKGQLFKFPDFDVKEKVRVASFNALKEMQSKEKEQLLLKYGCNLAVSAVYLSKTDRQNLRLTLQVFNHNTAAALKELGPTLSLTNHEDTVAFIDIICKWWDIFNVKTPSKCQGSRNGFQEPVTKDSDHIFDYLIKFLEWLENWKHRPNDGKLSRETHDALHHSTSALLKLSYYCLNVKDYDYVLLGQVQADKLEERLIKNTRYEQFIE